MKSRKTVFKQEETPRYHGRDVAIVRAKMEGALALLGSATPSMETYHHAREGKYELLTLASRVAERVARECGSRRLARGFSANAPGQPDFRGATCGNSGMPGEWDAGAGADQSTRIFMVGTLPELWRVGAVRELQYFDDPSQTAQPAGVPLLRIDSGDPEKLSEVPVEVRLFFWRRFGAP